MNTEQMEEDMRLALFGDSKSSAPVFSSCAKNTVPDVLMLQPVTVEKKKKISKGLTPRLKVTLRVGNEFEGKTYEMVHEADTLSTLVAEQEAIKIAKKKIQVCRSGFDQVDVSGYGRRKVLSTIVG